MSRRQRVARTRQQTNSLRATEVSGGPVVRHSASVSARKLCGPAPVVEPLEDRQLLSHLGPPWVQESFAFAPQAPADRGATASRPIGNAIVLPDAHTFDYHPDPAFTPVFVF